MPSDAYSPANELAVRRSFKRAARKAGERHDNLHPVHEHGHWWMQCLACGKLWDAALSQDGFVFEEVSQGDESCRTS